MKPTIRYATIQHKESGLEAIKLLDEPFAGMIVAYGKISADTSDEDNITLSFEYELIEAASKQFADMGPFEQYLGDLLQQIIFEGLQQHIQQDPQ